MPRVLQVMVLSIAVASMVAAAILALLPVMVLGLVTLFYNSIGGLLIFLGSLISLLPLSAGMSQGGSSLPIFQRLATDPGEIVLQSVSTATLCAIAATAIMAQDGKRNSRTWSVAGLCCLLASFVGGRLIMLCLMPAVVISVGHLSCLWVRARN